MSRYAAYVGCHTFLGKSRGIALFDVDVETGRFTKRGEVDQNNCTYLAVSPDRKVLYACVDEGISAFRILPDGDLSLINTGSIRGLRGCYLDVHPTGRFIVASGYHDGKMTVLSLREDGSVGDITEEVYNHGIGSVAERNFRPHICCSEFDNSGQYLFMVDSGIDQIRVFSFNELTGKARMESMVHADLNSGPHRILFPANGRFAYVMNELTNTICVYDFSHDKRGVPTFTLKQTITTLPNHYQMPSAACCMVFSPNEDHLFCSNAGENTVAFYDIDPEDGTLAVKNILPISGDYPIDVKILPDSSHMVCVNHDSNSLTFFRLHYSNDTLVMNGLPIRQDLPNHCLIVELPET
ncbi:MAG: lactonase family protein [Lachnospiraceae bacterium]|nr:lactonase family protein [Lachnospiraceae bacterium]